MRDGEVLSFSNLEQIIMNIDVRFITNKEIIMSGLLEIRMQHPFKARTIAK